MKAKDVTTGSIYNMKVSGKVVPVRVLHTITRYNPVSKRESVTYVCVNTITGRECKARSASKFRSAVKES